MLAPCFGFEIAGPDVAVAEAMLPVFGVSVDDAGRDEILPDPQPGLDPHQQATAVDCQGPGQ